MSGGSVSRPRGGPRAWPLLLALALTVAACTGDGETTATTTTVPATTVPPAPRIDDGRLRLGLLLPTDAPLVSDAIRTTAEAVIADIDEAGGVLGRDVELTIADEGGTATEAAQVILGLIEEGVDAIVGPITSTNAISAVDLASSEGIVTCSPTATAALLDDVPDDMLFFRTIASDSAQAIAIAEAAENTGARTVSIAHIDDGFGRPYAAAVADALDDRSLQVMSTESFSPTDDLSEVIPPLATDGAEVLVVLAAGPDLAAFVSELGAQSPNEFDAVITNDAIRTPANQPIIAELPTALRQRLIGVAPQIVERRLDAEPIVFAPQVTDCLTLLALATIQANSDAPRLIAAQMPSVSAGGRTCQTFASCAAQIEDDRQIDYNGPTGVTELNRVGETSRAFFERFTFDADGTDQFSSAGRLQVTL